jgi:hypothetical protein
VETVARLLAELESAIGSPPSEAEVLDILAAILAEIAGCPPVSLANAVSLVSGKICKDILGNPRLDQLDPDVRLLVEDVGVFLADAVIAPDVARSFDSAPELLRRRIEALKLRFAH